MQTIAKATRETATHLRQLDTHICQRSEVSVNADPPLLRSEVSVNADPRLLRSEVSVNADPPLLRSEVSVNARGKWSSSGGSGRRLSLHNGSCMSVSV